MKVKMMVDRIVPAAGYVLIEPDEAPKKTVSGIVLPESHDEKPQQGRVLTVGADEIMEGGKGKRVAPCKKGDVVIYKKWGGNEVKVEGKECYLLKFEDILALVK